MSEIANRVLKIEFHPTATQRDLLYRMMRSSAQIYNTLIEHLRYKQEAYRRAKAQCPDLPAWEVDPYSDIRCKGWANDLIIALTTQQACLYPKQLVNKPARQGKNKGKDRLVVATEKHGQPDYGIPAQSKCVLCQDFEASIIGYFTKRKNGDSKAELPKRFKGLHTLFFTNQLVKRRGNRLILGTEAYGLKLRVPELLDISIDGDVSITRSRSGKFYLCINRKFPVERNPELTEVAAIDFGQKRAMVLALKDGSTATINGKNILALKRERDNRYREINRLRSRVQRGQIRQYLTPEEKLVYRQLRQKDNERQRQGKPRRGADIRYALRLIRQRRKELGLKRRSNREMVIKRAQEKAADYYRVRLTYANHCVTRAAVTWCIQNKVGKVYVGKLGNLPKGRKKGKRRIKQVARNNRWEMPTQVRYLDEKLELEGAQGTEAASEAFSSQVCPNCGRRHKPRNRNYYCNPRKGGCGWLGDRDGVGSCNFLSSVLYGACGNIKPAHNRTLRIAPAIRQGLAMHSPDSSNTVCDLAEDAAKDQKSSDLRESGTVQISIDPRTARNTLFEGKTQGRGGMGELAKAGTSDPIDFDDTCSQATASNSGESIKRSRRSLPSQSAEFVQLSLWDSA